jgi:GH35 family endo-1,4-beta-xylanase
MNLIKKVATILGILIIGAVASVFIYFFVPLPFFSKAEQPDNPWGVDFSQSQAEYFKLDWKETYLAIIKDLGVKNIKLHTNWNAIEIKKGDYGFSDTDWQISQAEKNNVSIIYVLGLKTGRWPECHTPVWMAGLSKKDQQDELLKYVSAVVGRYKNSKAIINWQVENEPLFKFGECPAWYYNNGEFLKKEVELVRSLDSVRKIIISDSGEQSNWFDAAKIGDIVGTTMYRSAWVDVTDKFGMQAYSFLNPTTYMRKAQLIQTMFGKPVICVELQAEPWTSEPLMQSSLEEQTKSMNLEMFKEDVEFAKKTGFSKFYFWGAEWWYWMKTKQNKPEIWNEAKKLF